MAHYAIYNNQSFGRDGEGKPVPGGVGIVELSKKEVDILVNLIKEKGTTNVYNLQIDDLYPDIYEKLDRACHDLEMAISELHWFWEEFTGGGGGFVEYDTAAAISYCEENCGFSFEFDEEDYLDDEGEINQESLDEDKQYAFESWLHDYLQSMSDEKALNFFYDHVYGRDIDMDLLVADYAVEIPQHIIEMAKNQS